MSNERPMMRAGRNPEEVRRGEVGPAVPTPTERLISEGLIPLRDAAQLLGSSTRAVLDWIVTGVRSGDRATQLEGLKVGGKWLTSRAAIARFIDAQAAAKSLTS